MSINMRLKTRQLVETMSNNAQVIIQTPAGNDTFMNKVAKFTFGEYSTAVGVASTATNVHYGFLSVDNIAKDYLFVTTYAVSSNSGELVSLPLETPEKAFLKEANNDCLKKGGHWHPLSIHEYAALKYHHYAQTGKAYAGSNFGYDIVSGKTIDEAETGYSDVELNLGNVYNGIHLHEFPQLPVMGIRVVKGVFQAKTAEGLADKVPALWNSETDGWQWLDASTGEFKYVSDGIDTAKALYISDSTTKKAYQMSSGLISIGTNEISASAIDQLKLLQLYPNKLNPYLIRVGTHSDVGTYYPIFKYDCKEVMFWGDEYWPGDENTGALLCNFE